MSYTIQITEDTTDDFETEVEALRNSQTVQDFLDRRSQSPATFSLEAIEQDIDAELANS